MATAVNPSAQPHRGSSARPRTVIRMGASLFTIKAIRPPFPEATRDVNAEIMERFGPATFDLHRRNGQKADTYLGQLAASICHAHGIKGEPVHQRTPRKDRRPQKQSREPSSASVPLSM